MARELRTGARLAFDALGGVVDVVQDMHRAIARRALGPLGDLQSALAAPVYDTVRVGLAIGSTVAETALRGATRALPDQLVGVLNGAVGDRLATHYPALATPLALHPVGDHPKTGHLVVFLHGLIHTERHWRHEYGQRVADEIGASPLYVRYNSGLPVSVNGDHLAALLDEVIADWPVPVERLSLVGHSMGGLVARSAVHQATGRRWLDALTDVICLGSPHLGSPVERGAVVAGWLLAGFPESAPLATLVEGRSAGIKDLAHGAPYTAAPHVRQRFLAATIAADPTSAHAKIVGDLLVSTASATDGRGHDVLGGVSHLGLLDNPEVAELLITWLRA
jgi:pimeloyl-ACP methyl ester carboxylesterase